MKALELIKTPELPEEIIDAANEGQLVLFVGAGLSVLAGLPSWGQLARKVLEELRDDAQLINYSGMDQLAKLDDPRKQLSIADQIAKDGGYEINFRKHLQCSSGTSEVYDYINRIGCPCVTTNYDQLLAPRFVSPDGSTTPKEPTRIFDRSQFYTHHLNKPGTVVHLHGSIEDRGSMIVTTREYLEHYDNPLVKEFLGELFELKTVLFIGYGLAEAEILEHILRRGNARSGALEQRFALQGFYQSQAPFYKHIHNYYKPFGVRLIGFEMDANGHGQLKHIAREWAEKVKVIEAGLVEDLNFMDGVLADA